jgi:hypothetical protein
MPDPVNMQILDAMSTKILTITGIGARVYDYYLEWGEVEGYPAICFYATSEDTVSGTGVVSTTRKLWDMRVGIVCYVSGGDVRSKAYNLMKDIETVLAVDPTLGIGGVEQCRIVSRDVANIGSKDPQFMLRGMADLVANVRYRYVIGSP